MFFKMNWIKLIPNWICFFWKIEPKPNRNKNSIPNIPNVSYGDTCTCFDWLIDFLPRQAVANKLLFLDACLCNFVCTLFVRKIIGKQYMVNVLTICNETDIGRIAFK